MTDLGRIQRATIVESDDGIEEVDEVGLGGAHELIRESRINRWKLFPDEDVLWRGKGSRTIFIVFPDAEDLEEFLDYNDFGEEIEEAGIEPGHGRREDWDPVDQEINEAQ